MIRLGPDKAQAYRPGAAKLLAKQNIQAAANNSKIPPSLKLAIVLSRLMVESFDCTPLSLISAFTWLTQASDDNYVYYCLAWFMLRRYGK